MSSRPRTPTPMLPPMRASRPAWRQMWPIRAVVVDLPLVPVMATTLGRLCAGAAFTVRANSSMSPRISTPAAWACSTVQCGSGWVSGTPGESIRAAKLDQSAVARSTSGEALGRRPRARAAASRPRARPRRPPAMRARAAVRPGAGQAEHGDASCPRSRGPGSWRAMPSPTAASGWRGRAGPA